jgi:hypothetical protein
MGRVFWNQYYALQDSGAGVDVLAIGDSWFHYPFANLLTPLHAVLERPTIYAIGDNGARADELCRGSWRDNFRRLLAQHPTIRLVCISAGGNDFAGVGDLDDRILRPDCGDAREVDECYRDGEPDGVFATVAKAYRALVAEVAALRPSATVLLHNYDYAVPDGRALPGMRNWLALPMDNCRVPSAGAPQGGLRRDLVRDLIDRCTLVLDGLASTAPGDSGPTIELVWSAGTLADGQWANELHPRASGFTRIVRECWSGPARRALGLP